MFADAKAFPVPALVLAMALISILLSLVSKTRAVPPSVTDAN